MPIRNLSIYILFFIAGIFACSTASAQTASSNDSAIAAQKKHYEQIRIERQRKLDSTRKAQKAYYDSLKVARQHILDSTRKAQKAYNDSMQAARKRIMDSTIAARKAYFDSLRADRTHRLDSMRAVRQRVSDSLKVIREYRSSKRYKDSVTAVRQARLDSIKAVRTAYLDSVKKERKRVLDSTIAVRKAYTDSVKAVRQKRMDSLAVIREYRQSKRYKDSVQVVRQMRLDSIKAERKQFYDSVAAERKRVNDSVVAVRKAKLDSMKAVRTAYIDSIKAVRKVRSDSLAKLREKREKELEAKKKDREKKQQLALELKIKKKREAWSNEQMMKKKWSLPRQLIQNTFTRYNYYFNADEKMDEALGNMLRFKQEDYDSLLALYPFDPDVDSAVLAPDMDSIIQKASLGIQIHDPRTKWGDDLYLLLGQAYYYKGDYENASSSFRYVVALREKRKKRKNRNSSRRNNSRSRNDNSIVEEDKKGVLDAIKHRSVHNQAILWLARTYTEAHKEDEAESVLDLIENDPKFPESLRGRLALEKAYIYLSKGNYSDASPQLAKVSDDSKMPKWIRRRSAYLSGQLFMQQKDYAAAGSAFRKTVDLHPNVDMDFYAKKNLAYSIMYGEGDPKEAVALLEKVLKDGKYRNYHEQVYFVLGRLAAENGNQEDAIAYLTDGINSPQSTAEQKGLSYAMLGDIYYKQRAYELAKISYDSAANFASAAPDDTLMANAIKRGGVLENLTGPLNIIKNNDSLLALAALSEKEQRSVVRKYIKMLEKRRADSIFRAQNAGVNNAMRNSGNRRGNYANWYFANATQMQKGFNDFKQKWGNRPLTDNWRRSSSASFSAGDNAGEDEYGSTVLGANGLPSEASLLAFIPNDPKEQDEKRTEIRRAYVDAATAYIQDLEDYPPSTITLDTLDSRFPGHEHKAEALYLRYLVALRTGDLDKAKEYQDRLNREDAGGRWAAMVQPAESTGAAKTDISVANFYDITYQKLLEREYATTLVRSRTGQKQYKDKVYQNRFKIMEAISLAGMGDYNEADSLLTVFMSNNPKDSLRSWAEAVLNYINTNKPVDTNAAANANANAGNQQGQQQQKISADAKKKVLIPIAPKPSAVPNKYVYAPNEPHYVVFSFPAMEQRAKGVKAGISDFNKFKFASLSLNTDISMLNVKSGIVVTQQFNNINQAKIYMNQLKGTRQLFREYTQGEYQIFLISANNYKKMIADKDVNSYLKFYRANYK